MASKDEFALVKKNGKLCVLLHESTMLPIAVDFAAPQLFKRISPQNLPRELLIKAIGGRQYNTVLDTTAGLGRDGFLMAASGKNVTLLERHPDLVKPFQQRIGSLMYCCTATRPDITYAVHQLCKTIWVSPLHPCRLCLFGLENNT